MNEKKWIVFCCLSSLVLHCAHLENNEHLLSYFFMFPTVALYFCGNKLLSMTTVLFSHSYVFLCSFFGFCVFVYLAIEHVSLFDLKRDP